MSTRTPQDRFTKQARRTTVGIYLDDSLAEAHDWAVQDLEQERRRLEPTRERRITQLRLATGRTSLEVDEAAALAKAVDDEIAARLAPYQQKVDDAYAALDEGTLWFTFKAIGRKKWQELIAKHEPRPEDHERSEELGHGEKAAWNTETLPPALLAEAAVEPTMTVDEAQALLENDSWSDADIQTLVNAAILVQIQGRTVNHRRPPQR